jgi:hypothetical protein
MAATPHRVSKLNWGDPDAAAPRNSTIMRRQTAAAIRKLTDFSGIW